MDNEESKWEEEKDKPQNFTIGNISEKDKFSLAKFILIACVTTYIIAGGIFVFIDPTKNSVEKIWEFTSQKVLEITLLIIGAYFSSASKK